MHSIDSAMMHKRSLPPANCSHCLHLLREQITDCTHVLHPPSTTQPRSAKEACHAPCGSVGWILQSPLICRASAQIRQPTTKEVRATSLLALTLDKVSAKVTLIPLELWPMASQSLCGPLKYHLLVVGGNDHQLQGSDHPSKPWAWC